MLECFRYEAVSCDHSEQLDNLFDRLSSNIGNKGSISRESNREQYEDLFVLGSLEDVPDLCPGIQRRRCDRYQTGVLFHHV